jgi:uncharacterized protein
LPAVIDAHLHLSESNQDELIPYATLNGLRYDLQELLALMRNNAIASGLLLSPPLQGGAPLPNERVLDICRRSDGLLSPVFTVEPSREDVQRAVELAKVNPEVRAFKVRLGYLRVFAYDPVYDPLYAHAESLDLPVMFHTGDTATRNGSLEHSHPLTLDRLANVHPGLKVVVCHFGNPWMQDVAELIYKHTNVFADISGLAVGGSKYQEGYLDFLADQLTHAIYYAGGAEKVIFGTDYPVSTPSLCLDLVGRLKVDAHDRDAILSRNARRVFRL